MASAQGERIEALSAPIGVEYGEGRPLPRWGLPDSKRCSYPAWSIRKAKNDMQSKDDKKVKKTCQKESKNRGVVTIPYVKGLSEAFSRILKTYRICTAVRPHTTLRNMLVHPKDRINDEEKP